MIYIKAGAYFENVEVERKKKMLMFIGDGIGKTVVKASRNVVDGWTTFRSATVGKFKMTFALFFIIIFLIFNIQYLMWEHVARFWYFNVLFVMIDNLKRGPFRDLGVSNARELWPLGHRASAVVPITCGLMLTYWLL